MLPAFCWWFRAEISENCAWKREGNRNVALFSPSQDTHVLFSEVKYTLLLQKRGGT